MNQNSLTIVRERNQIVRAPDGPLTLKEIEKRAARARMQEKSRISRQHIEEGKKARRRLELWKASASRRYGYEPTVAKEGETLMSTAYRSRVGGSQIDRLIGIENLFCKQFGIPIEDMRSGSNRRYIVGVRQAIIYWAQMRLELSRADLAEHFNLSSTTIHGSIHAHIQRKWNEGKFRDEPPIRRPKIPCVTFRDRGKPYCMSCNTRSPRRYSTRVDGPKIWEYYECRSCGFKFQCVGS